MPVMTSPACIRLQHVVIVVITHRVVAVFPTDDRLIEIANRGRVWYRQVTPEDVAGSLLRLRVVAHVAPCLLLSRLRAPMIISAPMTPEMMSPIKPLLIQDAHIQDAENDEAQQAASDTHLDTFAQTEFPGW